MSGNFGAFHSRAATANDDDAGVAYDRIADDASLNTEKPSSSGNVIDGWPPNTKQFVCGPYGENCDAIVVNWRPRDARTATACSIFMILLGVTVVLCVYRGTTSAALFAGATMFAAAFVDVIKAIHAEGDANAYTEHTPEPTYGGTFFSTIPRKRTSTPRGIVGTGDARADAPPPRASDAPIDHPARASAKARSWTRGSEV